MSKKTPEINSSSTADIAFLLLSYFLMTTTMNQDSGLQRRLPPIPDENQEVEDQKVNRRNIIIVRINSADRLFAGLFAGNEPMDVSFLKDKVKEFLLNPNNDPNLPERSPKEIEGFGSYPVSKGVISLQNDRGTRLRGRPYLRIFPRPSLRMCQKTNKGEKIWLNSKVVATRNQYLA